ncbi:MAG: AAA family ATPase [Pseudomonadota bacterium]
MTLHISGFEIEKRIDASPQYLLMSGHDVEHGHPVLIKTLPEALPDVKDIKRLEREFWLLKDLDQTAGIIPVSQMVFHGSGNPAIVCAASGLPLSHYIDEKRTTAWSPDRIVRIVLQIARAMAAIHARNVIHKNIAPTNILLDDRDWSVRLMNFDFASALSREHHSQQMSRNMEGSPAYISPEQTGRVVHDVDSRSDIYSLGAVFFELLFGAKPFSARTHREWAHAHIGQRPQLPDDGQARVPETLSAVVLRMLEKSPEDRYQSAFGLIHDLERIVEELRSQGSITPFALGQKDVSDVFRIPQTLYGRQDEMAQLEGMFGTVVEGETRICLIAGHSGVGKTALVDALDKSVLRARGYMLRGKFDQFERARPYAGIADAFSGLFQEMLAEPPDRLALWKEQIQQSVGANLQALVEVLPDLDLIVGPQPDVIGLPPAEAQNRLQLCFLNLMRVFAEAGRPLILYLDDLQWSDVPTMSLLQSLGTARDISNLFILGAYRSNEVDGNHLVTLTRNEIAKHRRVEEINLSPLVLGDVHQIIADALRDDSADTQALARYVFQKTDGNPFFARELLETLAYDGLIRLDPVQGLWVCDIARVNQAAIGDNVVTFLIGVLAQLPKDAIEAIKLAACIGHEFDMNSLALLSGQSKAALGQALMPALARNVILPLDEAYQLFDSAGVMAEAIADSALNPSFRFQHDRLYQAAYEIVDVADRPRLHLSVGQTLLRDIGGPPAPQQLVKVTRHLNEGATLLEDPGAREGLARFNLMAARMAHDASSYPAALHYARTAQGLLPTDHWRSHYGLSKDLSKLLAQATYLNGLHDEADAELTTALENLQTPLEQAQVLAMRTRHYSTLGRMQSSIDAALQGLALLGITIGHDISQAQLEAEIAAVADNLGARNIADLAFSDRMTDESVLVSIELLMEIFPAAFLSGAGKMFYFVVLRSVNLSLQHGNSTETAFAFAAYGMLLCGGLDDPATGYEYGRLALTMNESYEDIGLKSRIIYVYGMFIHHWSNHWSSLTDWFKRGIESGYQSGDLLYLAYNAQDCIIWDPTLDIQTAIDEQVGYLEIVRDCQYRDSLDSGTLFLQMLKNFAGQTEDVYALSDGEFDEAACLKGMIDRRFMTGVANYNIYKAELHCFYGDFDGALPFVDAQEPLIDSVMSLPQSVRFRFLAFMTYAHRLCVASGDEAEALRAKMAAHFDKMALWAWHNPGNFEHLSVMMQAQRALIDNDLSAALRDFERAIEAANASGFTRDQAMAHEYAAHAFAQANMPVAADAHMARARHLFAVWGAQRKVEVLDARLGPGGAQRADTAAVSSDLSEQAISQESLDLESLMVAARTISGEVSQKDLLDKSMSILLQSTGARRGLFLRPAEAGFTVELECVADGEATGRALPGTMATSAHAPKSILNYVSQSKRTVRMDDAASEHRFDRDPYLQERRTKSVLCLPVQRAEQISGIVYLENDLTTGAFPQERLGIVEMLAAQTAISLENAKLYDDLERKIAERTEELSTKSNALAAVANKLSKYLSPQVYRSLFDQEQEVRLRSERKTLTVFFSDLVGFTEIAERMDSMTLKTILNQYLSEMSDIALAHGATIDKFVGDAILAFFGDPETRGTQQDALACAQMALEMRRRLAELKQEWHDQKLGFSLECRMGIHTGPCAVGNFGSTTRMDYTVIGRAVNLASRLEAAAAPGGILISQATHDLIHPHIPCERHGQIKLRGIDQPVETFAVQDPRGL